MALLISTGTGQTMRMGLVIRVNLGEFESNTVYAQYFTFSVDGNTTEYNLTIGGYSGTAGDSLTLS